MTGAIPFDQIRDAALAHADRLLADWFPQGKKIGRIFRVGNIHGDPGESMSVNLTTGKWSDFAGADSGFDLIDLCAAKFHGGDRTEAARDLGTMLGVAVNGHDSVGRRDRVKGAPDWCQAIPPPPDAGRPSASSLARFDTVFEYTDAHDRVTHYVGRIEARGNRGKVFIPIVFGVLDGVRGWHDKHPSAPKPLYGLNRLSSAPDATVILCEGEKSADAAQTMYPKLACISWCGGTGSVDHADFTPRTIAMLSSGPITTRRAQRPLKLSGADCPVPGRSASAICDPRPMPLTYRRMTLTRGLPIAFRRIPWPD
jgi:putative DNA primase/helicase